MKIQLQNTGIMSGIKFYDIIVDGKRRGSISRARGIWFVVIWPDTKAKECKSYDAAIAYITKRLGG